MNSFTRSQLNDRRQFITDLGIFALSGAFPFPLWLHFGSIAVSWKLIYIRGIGIMIQLHVVAKSPEQTYKVVYIIRCVLEQEVLFCASHVM